MALVREQFWQQLAAAAAASLGGGNPLQVPHPFLAPRRELTLADPLLQMFGYWKSKVFEVHCNWKEVTGEVDVGKLDKRNLVAEKKFEKLTIPNFKLGSRVRIVGEDKRLFKILHKKIGIWKEGLAALIGREAIVMNLSSRFVIGVSLADNGEMAQVHGFALELVETSREDGNWQNKTEFDINDDVTIGVDNDVLAQLQRNVRKTPFNIAMQLVSFIGRVMGVFRGEVVVTFDEMRHEMFHPAALKKYSDHENGNKKKLTKKPTGKDIRIGTKAIVNSNLAHVMQLQIGHGEWNFMMTKFVGKEGTIVDNEPGGDVIVKFNPFESYRMNRQALNFENKKRRARTKSENEVVLDPLTPFAVGDIVRLKADPNDLVSNLQLLRIPGAFLTIISDCMTFTGYLDRLRGVVDVGDGVGLILELALLTKVGSVISEEYKKITKLDREIEVGKQVAIHVGPKNFVKTCLTEFRKGFEKALEEDAKLEGYDDGGNAVIRYADGKLYSVPDEYLCTPRPMWKNVVEGKIGFADWTKEPVDLPSSVTALEATILHSVTEVLKSIEEKDAIGWTSVISKAQGKPNVKVIDVTFPRCIKDSVKFFERFKSKLESENLPSQFTEGYFAILADGCAFRLNFHSEDAANGKTTALPTQDKETPAPKVSFQDAAAPTPAGLGRSLSVNEVLSERDFTTGNAATPFGPESVNIPIPQGVKQVVLQFGAHAQVPTIQQPIPGASAGNPARPTGIVTNPTHTTINMYGDGENKVNIDKSYVREIQQS